MAGSWGISPLFAHLNLNAWAFWIALFVMVVAFFAFIRIIYMICMNKLKRRTISVIDLNTDNTQNSTQAVYTSVIAPHYFYNNGENFNESVNASNEVMNKNTKYSEKFSKGNESFDGVDCVSESYDLKNTPIRPLTPAYKPHEVVSKEDPLGLLSVPPGFVASLANNHIRIERITHSA